MSTTTKKTVILSKPADWDPWISFVQARATSSRVWNLINPNVAVKPVALEEPIAPRYVMPVDDANFNINTYNAYKARKDLHKTDLELYERQQKALSHVITFIQDTIATHNVTFIQKVTPHPWDYLRALKQRLAPDDEARTLEIERKYHKLCKGPGTQNLETWLDDWMVTFTEAKEHSIFEVGGTRTIRDFLMAISSKESSYANAHLVAIRSKKGIDLNLFELIEDFRQHLRLQQIHQPSEGSSHSAFATGDSNPESSKNTASFRGQQTSFKPPCICGETHWFADCYYLVPEKRPTGWNVNPTKQKKVNDALQDVQTKATVDKALQRRKDREDHTKSALSTQLPSSTSGGASTGVTRTTASTNANLGSFCVKSAFSTFSASTYPLQGSWILDNSSDTHICNSTMLSRFTQTRLAQPNDQLTAGTQTSAIECFGTIDIIIQTPTGPQLMTLKEVAYVSEFMTNVVCEEKLRIKGVFFDNQKMHLHRDGVTIGFVENHHGHRILENNLASTIPKEPLASFAITKAGSVEDWHHILGHASHDAIKHLENSAEGVEVSEWDDQVLKTDLAQLTTEPMIDTVYDIPSLDVTSQITEIESDEEDSTDEDEREPADEDKSGPPSTPAEAFKDQNNVTHLPTPDPTEISLLASPSRSTDSELTELGPSTGFESESNFGSQTAAPRANEILATLDTANVLLEGVGRTRGTHRNVYTTTLGPEPANPHRVDIDNG